MCLERPFRFHLNQVGYFKNAKAGSAGNLGYGKNLE
jgi:hypothetical protein